MKWVRSEICFLESWQQRVLPDVSSDQSLPKVQVMTRPTTPLLISVGWIGLVLATFVVVEASSLRSWLYLVVIALLPPLLVNRLWNRDPGETRAGLSHITDSK